MRMSDCKEELRKLLVEDVRTTVFLRITSYDSADDTLLVNKTFQRLAGASLLVFANKQDIAGAMSSSEIRDALDLHSIRSHNWHIWSCSAMTGENLVEGLDWVVNEVAQRLYYSATVVEPASTSKSSQVQNQDQKETVQVS